MPDWLKILLQLLKDNPQAVGDLIALIRQIVELLNKHPGLADGLASLAAKPAPKP